MALAETEKPTPEKVLPYLTKDRPNFGPTQIRTPEEIRSGKSYTLHEAGACLEMGHGLMKGDNGITSIEFTSLGVYRSDNGIIQNLIAEDCVKMQIILLTSPAEGIYYQQVAEKRVSLFKAGLEPDENGNWHSFNWIEDKSKDKKEDAKPDGGKESAWKTLGRTLFQRNPQKN